ncbi:MAG: rhodanese-like domain-containing protein, partial [Clostridia bacterium]|nr:rhodanese-like domain-containing protein [Clostridia bacterium]
ACNNDKNNTNNVETSFENTTNTEINYEQISQTQAKQIMDSSTDYLIVDARTLEEFNEGHIKNAINLDYEEVTQKAENLLPDKNQLILIYCRSGRRSKIAAQSLCELGYTNVKEFGGIIDWQYEVVQDDAQ